MKSTRTTVAGLAAGIGMLAHTVECAFGPGGNGWPDLVAGENLTLLVASLGALLMGLFARDDHVSSEGTRATKDTK